MTEKVSLPERLPERLEATFLTSAPDLRHAPKDEVPEVAFAGRSNSGKSSVLNQLTGNRRTAKVSKTPGRTQLLNFFDLHTGGRFVDLPGYGYAKAGRAAQATWQKSVNNYLSRRDNLVGLVLVMDIRHPNQSFDEEILQWAEASELPVHVLLNKADKMSNSRAQQAAAALRRTYRTNAWMTCQSFSASTGHGRDELIAKILGWINSPAAT